MTTAVDNDLRLTVNSPGGLPMSVAGFILRALGVAYPGTMMETSRFGEVLALRIPRADYLADREIDDATLAELAPGPDDADLLMLTNGIRDGALGARVPDWLNALLRTATASILDASDATNYLSMDLMNPNGSLMTTWIICRPDRPTPHQLRQAADERVAVLEAQLRDAGIEPLADGGTE